MQSPKQLSNPPGTDVSIPARTHLTRVLEATHMDANIAIPIISASGVLAGMLAQHLLAMAAASRAERRQRRIEVRNRFEECVVRLLERN
jgi:hypothetical protein